MTYDYDLIAIGSGPGGQRAAIQASKVGRRSAVVERRLELGGVSVNTGTIASKTLRETVLHLTGQHQRAFYGSSYRVKADITFDDLRARSRQVIEREIDVIRSQLTRNHVQVLTGAGSFVDAHTVALTGGGLPPRTVTAESFVIAVGTRPARPAGVDFDDRTVIDSDGLLQLGRIPREIVVVGAGVIGVEYASMFAALGSKVTLVESRRSILEFCDAEIVEGLRYHLRDEGVTLRLGETVVAVEPHEHGCVTQLASGKRIASEAVLYSAGRQGAVDDLGLERVGLEADERGRIRVDEDYRTAVPNIYAAGDVIGFPSLAATSMEQGRVAACRALGEPVESLGKVQPIGIYSIPEISYVGRTEEDLTEAGIPYETGVARYRELARGQILGDTHGMLKLCVSPDDQSLLGVHALGTDATEIIHIGQAIMALGGTLHYLVNTVFNYPTMAESYKVAALNAMNKLRDIERIG